MRRPGIVALFGSGETSTLGRKVHHHLLAQFRPPVYTAVLETPAGFEVNSYEVADTLKRFLQDHLPDHRPHVAVVRARNRRQAKDPSIVHWLLPADYIFAGPGSPTYMVRHLRDTLAWQYMVRRHQEGATLALASAAAIAIGSYVLPVYEIYKAGHDLHWLPGLDLLGPYGLNLAVVTHWDNRNGGEKIDTTRCFMGRQRFQRLERKLPPETIVLAIDEHTACILDFQEQQCTVMGRGAVTVRHAGRERRWSDGQRFPMRELRA